MNFGKIVFAQIMQFIPRREFNDIVAKYRGNYRVRNLTCYDQLLVMCLAQYADKNSLRDIEASLNALAVTHRLYHCGISYAVPRNTLAKANELRDWHIYAELGQVLIKKVISQVYFIVLYRNALVLRVNQILIRQVFRQICRIINIPCVFKIQV